MTFEAYLRAGARKSWATWNAMHPAQRSQAGGTTNYLQPLMPPPKPIVGVQSHPVTTTPNPVAAPVVKPQAPAKPGAFLGDAHLGSSVAKAPKPPKPKKLPKPKVLKPKKPKKPKKVAAHHAARVAAPKKVVVPKRTVAPKKVVAPKKPTMVKPPIAQHHVMRVVKKERETNNGEETSK